MAVREMDVKLLASGMQPKVEPVGKCPHCHYALDKREVTQRDGVRDMMVGAPVRRLVLLTYWGCTNDECCSMFWRMPVSLPYGAGLEEI